MYMGFLFVISALGCLSFRRGTATTVIDVVIFALDPSAKELST